ncbi:MULTISPECIES: hypothetical protein [Cetobacterium]|uniref:Uncharacterized protein n=1 Tax=Candidatus Cetobacterium colombiensis TaxID=3073100 RepID=A0ABU4WDH8_9FUSO|nr:hypothetical protein [Candidatus Cetobacterium colombiensis]MDX8336774.1 hypothetical protein [Candidatus Cetobacterium colombiensis]
MKKFLLVSMMALGLGTVAMANGNNGHRGFQGNQKYNSGKMSTRQCQGSQTNEERALMREKIRTNPKLQEGRIKLQENKVAMMKEMAKETPNFSNIEKINKDRANIQAEMKTERMKMRYEALKANKTTN